MPSYATFNVHAPKWHLAYFCQLMAILAKLLDMDFKFVLPRINSNSRTDFDYFTWGGGGGCGQIMGGVIVSLITGSLGGTSHRLTRVNFSLK